MCGHIEERREGYREINSVEEFLELKRMGSESVAQSDFLEFGDTEASLMEIGSGNYGCSHYRRRCKIRAPCCNEIFDCRHCHNDAKNGLETNPLDRHDIPRHEVTKVFFYFFLQLPFISRNYFVFLNRNCLKVHSLIDLECT